MAEKRKSNTPLVQIDSDESDDNVLEANQGTSHQSASKTASNISHSRKRKSLSKGGIDKKECEQNIDAGIFSVKSKEKFRAEYWQHFYVVIDESGIELPFVKCKKCSKVFKRSDNAGNQSFDNHTKTCQDDRLQKKITSYAPAKVTQDSKKKVADSLALMCAKDSRAFWTVEGQGFIGFVNTLLSESVKYQSPLRASDILPCAQTVSNHVKALASGLRKSLSASLKQNIENYGGCITTDFWKEELNKLDYLDATYHWIDKNWTVQKKLLFCAEYDTDVKKEAHLVRQFFLDRLAPFGITEEVCDSLYVVTDAGTNMIKAMNFPGKRLIKRITCAGHQLNTALSNCFNRRKNSEFRMPAESEPIWRLLESCKTLVAHCNKSVIAAKMNKKLIQSVDTRWNTKLTMLESVIQQYDLLSSILEERKEKDFLPAPLELMKELSIFLKPFEFATAALCVEDAPTLHLVMLHYMEIIRKIELAPPSTTPAMAKFQVHCCKVVKAKLHYEQIHKSAVFLTPAMKRLTMLNTDEARLVQESVRKMFPVDDGTKGPARSQPAEPHPTELNGVFDLFAEYADARKDGAVQVSLKDEVDLYLGLNPPPLSFNLLMFWRDQEQLLPKLTCVARKILSVQASSTPSERLFSQAGNIFLDRRNRLSSEKLDDLLFLMWNDTSI